MESIIKIKQGVSSIDITKLALYTNKIKEIGQSVNAMNASLYLQDFILAYETASTFLSVAIKYDEMAGNAVKEAEAIAFLDNSTAALDARGIKVSAAAREKYVHIDPAVKDAREIKAQTTALVNLMKNKVYEFRYAMEAVKKIAYTQEAN